MAEDRCDRQDAREQQPDRSRRSRPAPRTDRGASRLQVVRAWPARGSLGFGGEESAGASFLRRDGTVWTTDKDGMILALLAAEIIARTGKDQASSIASKRASTASRSTSASMRQQLRIRRRSSRGSNRGRSRDRAGRLQDRGGLDKGARQRRTHRRAQGRHGRRLVRGAAFGYRGCLQDLRGKLPRARAPEPHPDRGPGARHGGAATQLAELHA